MVHTGDIAQPYEAVGQIVRRAVENAAQQRNSTTDALMLKMASASRVSEAAARSWMTGFRAPSKANLRAIAKVLLTSNDRRDKFIKDVERARKHRNPPVSWQVRLEHGSLSLQVRPARYAGAGRFLEDVVLPFLDLGRIKHGIENEPKDDFRKLGEQTWSGKLDIALGILATPEIRLRLWCYESPPRYRVNFVVTREGLNAAGMTQTDLQRLLSVPTPYTGSGRTALSLMRRLKFVAMKGEIGRHYARRVLNVDSEDFALIDELDVKRYAASLFRSNHDSCLCVAADEITCLAVVAELRANHRTDGILVFPLGSPIEDLHSPGAELPYFPLAMCVSDSETIPYRFNKDLIDYLERALPSFIEGNSVWIARAYAVLREQLAILARTALPEANPQRIREWLDFCLRLTPEAASDVTAPWATVLRQAKAIISHCDAI